MTISLTRPQTAPKDPSDDVFATSPLTSRAPRTRFPTDVAAVFVGAALMVFRFRKASWRAAPLGHERHEASFEAATVTRETDPGD
jgi:hypothetical protein